MVCHVCLMNGMVEDNPRCVDRILHIEVKITNVMQNLKHIFKYADLVLRR